MNLTKWEISNVQLYNKTINMNINIATFANLRDEADTGVVKRTFLKVV